MAERDRTVEDDDHPSRYGLWQSQGGNFQAFVITLSNLRYGAAVFRRGSGVYKNCPHRHTSIERAFQCAKNELSRATPGRILRTR